MGDSIIATAEYDKLLDSIKRTLAAGQLRAARAVNNVLVETYWQIGREIVVRRREQGCPQYPMTSAVPFRSTARIPGPGFSRSARICAAMSSTVGRPSEFIRRCGGTRRSRSVHNWR